MEKITRKLNESTYITINVDEFIVGGNYVILPNFTKSWIDIDKRMVEEYPICEVTYEGFVGEMLRFMTPEHIVIDIDPTDPIVRNTTRIFEWCDSDTFEEIEWYNIKTCPFDSSFFKVGHPYHVRMNRTEEMKYMLLIDKRFDRLIFVLGEYGKSTLYEVTDVKYKNQKKEYWYSAVLREDTWSDKDENVEKEEME